MEGSLSDERALHKRFQSTAEGHEWFRESAALRAEIRLADLRWPLDDAPYWQGSPYKDSGDEDKGLLAEFIGTSDFASQWVLRQCYEVGEDS